MREVCLALNESSRAFSAEVLKSMVMERLHRPIVFVSAVSEAAEAAGSAKYILVVPDLPRKNVLTCLCPFVEPNL